MSKGTGDWHHIYEWYATPVKLIVSGKLVDGKKEGEWTCRLETGEYLYKEMFKNGKFKSGYTTNYDGSKNKVSAVEFQNKFMPPFKFEVTEQLVYTPDLNRSYYPFLKFLPTYNVPSFDSVTHDGVTYYVVEESAKPKGGMDNFYRCVAQNLKYPVQARRMGIEGKVFVEFTINEDGSVSDAKVIKGIGSGCDEEALKVITKCTEWEPGKQRGKPVKQRMVVPITFKLG